MPSFKIVFCLVAGSLLVPCLSGAKALRPEARAQGAEAPAQNQALQNATEAQVKDAWSQLQKESEELEATDARAAIARYQTFFEAGGSRFPSVGLGISLRIAGLWQVDLKNPDKALEIYDWALANYKNQPDAVLLLQKARLAAQQAQAKADGASSPQTLVSPLTGQPITAPPLMAPVTVTGMALSGRALGWQPGLDRCVTALAQGSEGTLWVATEDSGVWRYDPTVAPSKDRWTQFNVKNGLADNNAYALAVDKRGRVWAGTLNHGVSVWNGQGWRNYGVMDGPSGERVFAIAVCPLDGDVWIATNAGLTRYSMEKDSWSYITRAQGLPSDQVQAIAFDKEGNLIVGTQCDGVALASAADGYKTWRAVKGPEQMPTSAMGQGLPGNLINDVLVARDGTFYAATTTGLAWSSDRGENWKYVRGQDYAAKVRGLYGGAPTGWKEGGGALLAEDYVSCLAEDEGGRIWVGHWQAGSEVLSTSGGSVGSAPSVVGRESNDLVRAILPRRGAPTLIARYDSGLSQSNLNSPGTVRSPAASGGPLTQTSAVIESGPLSTPNSSLPIGSTVAALPTDFPRSAATTPQQLQQLLSQISITNRPLQAGEGLFWDEDWNTQGDWMGRYGRQRAILCAAQSPLDNNFGFDPAYLAEGFTGPHALSDDSLRNWVHWIKTDNPRTLYNPVEGYRRHAEWDDHGEAYPMAFEGPDIWVKLTVPAGLHRVALYFFNKDGEAGQNRMRDYLIELKKGAARNVAQAQNLSTQARARVRDFRGGVYKRFVLRGPGVFWLRIGKNNSFNTIVSAVCLDKLVAEPTFYDALPLPWMSNVRYEIPPSPAAPLQSGERASIAGARRLWESLEAASGDRQGLTQVPLARVLALRAVSAEAADEGTPTPQDLARESSPTLTALLRRWRWMATQWSGDDRREWAAAMRQGYDASNAPHQVMPPAEAEKEKQLLLLRENAERAKLGQAPLVFQSASH